MSDSPARCPVHGTTASYWPAGDDWACTVPGCGYGSGIATVTSAASAILAALRPRRLTGR
ncbi:MAG: hypothetical protein M0030_16170 [Actinomycetota bacterium]|nr:hypothetical protein [Actinomycetota bacterium]